MRVCFCVFWCVCVCNGVCKVRLLRKIKPTNNNPSSNSNNNIIITST